MYQEFVILCEKVETFLIENPFVYYCILFGVIAPLIKKFIDWLVKIYKENKQAESPSNSDGLHFF